jgi:glycosyltransferase involved in cell wall biosynthesis
VPPATDLPAEVTVVAHDVGGIGGMELVVGELVIGLLKAGHGVTVVARTCDLPEHPRLHWVRVPGPARPFPLAYPWFLIVGSLLVWRHRRGVLHSTGAIVFNRVDVTTVHWCHLGAMAKVDLLSHRRPGFLYRLNSRIALPLSRLIERLCYEPRRVRHLVAVSRGVREEIEQHFSRMRGSISVIPNAVDPSVFHPDPAARARQRRLMGLSDDEFVALFLAGDWERKGLPVVVEAVARTPNCHLVVVGSGDSLRYLRLAGVNGAAGRIHFAGPTREPAPYYMAADVFVLASVYETFSLATYEAAATGLPLLATRVSGVEDILVDGWNGWFVKRDAGSIAVKLARLAVDPSLRKTMAERARLSSEPFRWEPVVESYIRLYRDTLDERSGRGVAYSRPA